MGQPCEPGIGIERTLAIAGSVVAVGQDQIHVGRKIQLAAAELAKTKHDQTLAVALLVVDHAMPTRHLLARMVQCTLQADLGEHAGAVQGCFDVIKTIHITPYQSQRFTLAEAAQFALHAGVVVVAVEFTAACIGRSRIIDQLDQAITKQLDVGKQNRQREVAGQQHLAQALIDTGIIVEANSGIAACPLQTLEALFERIGKFAWQGFGGSAHAVITPELHASRSNGQFTRGGSLVAMSRACNMGTMMDRLSALRRQPTDSRSGTRFAISLLIAIVVLVALIDQLDPAFAWTSEIVHATSLFNLLLLNALPLLTLLLVLLAVTRRVALATWLTALFGFALFAANSAKLAELQTPLLPSDFRFLAEPGPALALFAHYLKFNLGTVASLLAVFVITVMLVRRRGSKMLVGWRRLALAIFAAVLAVSLTAGSPPWRQLYSSKRMGFEPWALTESASRAGLIGSLLLYHWELGDGSVPNADRDAAIAMIDAHADLLRERFAATGATHEPPDILIIQSESLFDPARLNHVEPGRYLTEFRKLLMSSRGGELHVPTFGGGTIRTEFELLTGAPLSSLGGIQYPWLELRDARFPSLASILARNGYTTTAIHPNGAAFWNRNRVFPELGFQTFIDVAAFRKEDIVGLFTSDAALTDRVIAELKDDGPPQFLFAITMENHGPFDWRPNLDAQRLTALPMPPELDAGGRLWFGNYLYLLDDADHELGRLAEVLKQRKRRTLLLFFGDHLPSIHTVYYQLGFDDGQTELQQPTEWLLFDTANPHGVQEDTQSWLLPARLLDSAGIANEPYFVTIAALRDALGIDRQPITPEQATAINALAQLQLLGELDAVLEKQLEIDLTPAPNGKQESASEKKPDA